jgi:hypothetical protein
MGEGKKRKERKEKAIVEDAVCCLAKEKRKEREEEFCVSFSTFEFRVRVEKFRFVEEEKKNRKMMVNR